MKREAVIILFAVLAVALSARIAAARTVDVQTADAQTSTAPASVPLSPADEKLFEDYLQNVADFSSAASDAYNAAVAADEAHDSATACAKARESLDDYKRLKANIDNMVNQVAAIGDTSDAENEANNAVIQQGFIDQGQALVDRVCAAG